MLSHNDKVVKVTREIQAGNALVKVIESAPNDQDIHWLFLLKQLKNPETNRPVPTLWGAQKRNIIWDAKKQDWVHRNMTQKRGRKKNTPYVKKTPMTLPPANGQMIYFGKENNYVGLGFLIEDEEKTLVKVKDKYIFPANIVSRDKPWIFDERKNNHTLAHPRLKSTTLEHLRELTDDAEARKQVLEWNEIIASPSLSAVNFLFTPHDSLHSRLELLAKRTLVAKELGMILPLVIMGKRTPIKEYSVQQQFLDVIELHTTEKNNKLYRPYLAMRKLDLLQLIAVYNEDRRCKEEGEGKLYPDLNNLDEYVGELVLTLLNAGREEQLIAVLNAIERPLKSTKLDECLNIAVAKNHQKLAGLLLAKGADINYIPQDGNNKKRSTLSLAVIQERREIFSSMMKLAPEKFAVSSLQQALIYASELNSESSSAYYTENLFKTKIKFDSHVSYWENTGYTALHTATQRGYASVIKLICQHDGNPGKAPQANLTPEKTPLNIAFAKKDFKAIQIMLQYGEQHLTAGQRGDCVLKLLRAEQYALAKAILNSTADIDIQAYGATFANIIENIAKDTTMPELAKQTLALRFISSSFDEATTQEQIMNLIKLLTTCSPTAKAFLFQPAKGGTSLFKVWNGDSVCSFWSSIMKLAKNHLLDILNHSDQVEASKETKDFLGARRTSLGFVSTTASMKILNEQDRKKQALLILDERNKITDSLSKQYGLRR